MYMYSDYERLLKRRCLAMSHVTGKQINDITCIFDLKGFGITKVSKKVRALLGMSLTLSSNNYPETMAMTLCINTPVSFKTIWTFIKGFLDEKQRKKIIMVGSKYQDKLFKLADPECVPTFYGGKCELSLLDGDMNAPWSKYALIDEPGMTPD